MAENILRDIRENIGRVMIGKKRTIDLLLTCLAAGGHALIEDVPGTGKTVLARALAASAKMNFSRVQFTPDLLPSDVTGLSYFNQEKSKFVFREGPVFTNILLADEINRATPRTQSALLECMAERQVTVDGQTRVLEAPFFVIATQNPVETLGTFPLPEAQMDRFLMRIRMGTMSEDEEMRMIDRFIDADPLELIKPVADINQIVGAQRQCRKIYVHPDLRRYIARLVQKTRLFSSVSAAGDAGVSSDMSVIDEGVSPRGTLALVRASQGYAMLESREYVTPEDIREVTLPVLVHRCLTGGISSLQEKETKIKNALRETEVPTEDWRQ